MHQNGHCVREYAIELTERAMRCGEVFDDNDQIDIFVKGLYEDIFCCIQHYWSTDRSICMYTFMEYAVSIDSTRASRTRDLGTRVQKNNGQSTQYE